MSTDTTLLADLISRLEAATGPDRELDARIVLALNIRPDWAKTDPAELIAMREPLVAPDTWTVSVGYCGPSLVFLPYTASIDAALTLVPEGWFWRVGRTSIYQAWAFISSTHPDHGEPGRNEFAWKREEWEPPSHPALALCIAALKARAALAKEPT